jgi:hypothetical protein
MPGLQRADQFTAGHLVTDLELRADRLIGGAQPTGMSDADHASIGQPAGVDDRPRTGGVDRGAGGRGKIDTAMTGQPGLGRRIEEPHHLRPGNRPIKGGHGRRHENQQQGQ